MPTNHPLNSVCRNLPADGLRLLSTDGLRVGIRRFQPEDTHRLYEAVRESVNELCTFLTWCRPDYSLEDAASFIAQCQARWEAKEQYNFAIFDERTLTLLGSVGLNRIDWNHRCANVGYWVRRAYWQQGVATAATRLVARFGLEELGFHRLEILAPGHNLASQRVAHKAGARFEGALRNRLVLADGIYDAFLYSLVVGSLPSSGPAPEAASAS